MKKKDNDTYEGTASILLAIRKKKKRFNFWGLAKQSNGYSQRQMFLTMQVVKQHPLYFLVTEAKVTNFTRKIHSLL